MTPEIRENYRRFDERWQEELNNSIANLSGNQSYLNTYSRLISFQAWREELLFEQLSPGAFQFALEGQNDLLASYILARVGQWRSALQSLRSSIENYLNCLYYKDHPIELKLWETGSQKNKFSELIEYFKKHPDLFDFTQRETGIETIKAEYATLSLAVHASATSFRMTTPEQTNLFTNDVASLGKWESRVKRVSRGINLLLLSIFREHLTATKKRNLRKSIALSLDPGDKAWIKEKYSVTINFI